MMHPLKEMILRRQEGISCAIPSCCSANKMVLEACMEEALSRDSYVLIEATANQVNQFGGYTGMLPEDFKNMVEEIASEIGFPKDKIILGGDHLGPLVWSEEPAEEAMDKAETLVRLFTKAGYTKIHLDTSMPLGGDNGQLSDEIVAQRGVRLYKACLEESEKLGEDSLRPMYIIGSEVPTPGGFVDDEETTVTSVGAFTHTMSEYRKAFSEAGLSDSLEDIAGVVVQLGAEFGEDSVVDFVDENMDKLYKALEQEPGIMFEGHSTDYQTHEALRQMSLKGVGILKVGPALTNALREGLFALAMMEKILVTAEKQSNFMEILDEVMCEDPKYWIKHYTGDSNQVKRMRKYSYSDRCRYYFSDKRVEEAMENLLNNMNQLTIPMPMLHQFMPKQYDRVRAQKLAYSSRILVKDYVRDIYRDYCFEE